MREASSAVAERPSAVRVCGPGDAVDDEAVAALEALHRAPRLRAVDAVDGDAQRALERLDAGLGHVRDLGVDGRVRAAGAGDGLGSAERERGAEHGEAARERTTKDRT